MDGSGKSRNLIQETSTGIWINPLEDPRLSDRKCASEAPLSFRCPAFLIYPPWRSDPRDICIHDTVASEQVSFSHFQRCAPSRSKLSTLAHDSSRTPRSTPLHICNSCAVSARTALFCSAPLQFACAHKCGASFSSLLPFSFIYGHCRILSVLQRRLFLFLNNACTLES
jgi:hypothetical protein